MVNKMTTPTIDKNSLSKTGTMCRVMLGQNPDLTLTEAMEGVDKKLSDLPEADLLFFKSTLSGKVHQAEIIKELEERNPTPIEVEVEVEETKVPDAVVAEATEEVVMPSFMDAETPTPLTPRPVVVPVNTPEQPMADSMPISETKDAGELAIPVVTDNDEFAELLSNMSDFSVNKGLGSMEIMANIVKAQKQYASVQEVILNGSFYSAEISGFNLATRDAIRNSNSSERAFMYKIFQVLYDHIENATPFKPTFEDWLRITALSDLDSLYWAAYSATYRSGNEMKMRCTNRESGADGRTPCTNEIDLKFKPKDLPRFEDDRTIIRIADVLKQFKVGGQFNNVDDLIANSLVGMEFNLLLPESRVLVVSKMPSLADHLESMDKSKTSKATESIKEIEPFLKSVAMFNPDATRSSGSPQFDLVEDDVARAKLLNNLSDEDYKYWEKKLEEFISPFKVTYKTPDYKCNVCGHVNPGVELNMTSMVFRRLTE